MRLGPSSRARASRKLAGDRTALVVTVPLLREGEPIGVMIADPPTVSSRSRTQQIALLETFADQAVIAIENARLFEELEQRNRELDRGAGAADGHRRGAARHRVVADGPRPGPRAIVETAARLCEAPERCAAPGS